jgi:glycosyltransferase involved in cell wall biosynthesis
VRIAIVHPFTWADVRRGGERYAHDLTWWLAAQGHEVDYVTGGPAHSITDQDGARIVRLHHRHGERLTGWGVAKTETFGATVLPWLARNRYDVVHTFVPSAAIAARLARQRTVFTAIGHPGVGLRRRDRVLLKRATHAAHVTTALSFSAAEAIEAVTMHAVRIVNPGVRLDVFTPNIVARSGPPRVFFPAHAGEPRKRLDDLLHAWPRVLQALPDARLVIGGGGDFGWFLPEHAVGTLDVIGVGELDELPQRYRDATVTVLPSEDEAFGLVLVESLACGTPVVAARSGGMPEIVNSPDVGALAALGDVTELADAIIAIVGLAGDPETPPRCTTYAQQWGWDKVGADHLAAYEAAFSTT